MLTLFFLVCASFAVAADPTVPSPSCVHDKKDAYEPARLVTGGSFKGQCLDVESVRPVQILGDTPEKMSIAGFYDKGKFWRAEIPKNSVQRVLFQIVPFESGVPLIQAAHTQLRFLLRKDILLAAQSGGEKSAARDVILSSTFTAPVGQEYSAVKSLGGSYGIVTRLLSSHARGKEEIQKDKSIVRQFVLKLSPREMDDLLFTGLRRSNDDGYSQVYDLRKNNCTTISFAILDQIRPRPPGVAPVVGSWWNIRDEFIKPSINGLTERLLIDEKSEVRPMNDEMRFE